MKEIDFGAMDLTKTKKLIKEGYNPIKLSIAKWKWILKTEYWEFGTYWVNCGLCVYTSMVASKFEDDRFHCGNCPLYNNYKPCNNDKSAFYKFHQASKHNYKDRFLRRYAQQMLHQLEKLKHTKLKNNF